MRRRWSAKHKRHGLLVIALTDVKGRLLWTSTARPARGSEITACRHEGGRFLDAIPYVDRTGIPWRHLLLDYPHNGSRRGRL